MRKDKVYFSNALKLSLNSHYEFTLLGFYIKYYPFALFTNNNDITSNTTTIIVI